MDIHCRYCGEPWDHDELHEIEGHTYKQAAVAFRSYGCGAFGVSINREDYVLTGQSVCKHKPIFPPDVLELIAVSQDLSPYPDEWADFTEIEIMLQAAEEMF